MTKGARYVLSYLYVLQPQLRYSSPGKYHCVGYQAVKCHRMPGVQIPVVELTISPQLLGCTVSVILQRILSVEKCDR